MSKVEHPTTPLVAPVRRWRIVVENTPGVWRYVATIVPYGLPDGGFGVIPAYQGQEGWITKIHMMDTFSHLVRPPQARLFGGRRVTRRVKLSFHQDGATQISAADISTSVLSGRDETGSFRGAGILGRSFEDPVSSGSVFSITCWGLEHFPRERNRGHSIHFTREELGRKGLLGRAALLLQGYLIKRTEAVERFEASLQIRLRSQRWNGQTGRRELMELRLVELRNEHAYLGVTCFRIPRGTYDGNPSGFVLASQRSLEHIGLWAVFPSPGAKFYGTLDRKTIPASIIRPLGYD